MRAIFISVWSDIRRNKFFTILTFLEILVLTLVIAIILHSVSLTKIIDKNYNDEFGEAVLVKADDFEKLMGDKGFDNYAASCVRHYNDKAVSVIDPKLSSVLNVAHSGKWYSGEINADYKEALVSKKLKNKYKLNQIYPLSENVNILVIGYLASDNLSVSMSLLQYDYLFSNDFDIMLCDNISKEEIANDTSGFRTIIMTFGIDKSYYIQNLNYNASTLFELRKTYVDSNSSSTYYYGYLVLLLFGLVVVGVLCNSVFQVDYNIKRNMVKFVSGSPPAKIVASECVKAGLIFALPWVIAFLVSTILILSASKNAGNDGSYPLLSWGSFWTSSAMVLGVYVLSIISGLIRILVAKPLDELKK